MPTRPINDFVVSGVKTFLDALNAGGGTPIEQLSPRDARQVLTDAQNSVQVDLSGVEKSERTIDRRRSAAPASHRQARRSRPGPSCFHVLSWRRVGARGFSDP